MSTLEATVSMLEVMPEDARIKVFQYTQQLFGSEKPANPFTSVSTEQILEDLSVSRQEIAEGKGMDARTALTNMGKNMDTKVIISSRTGYVDAVYHQLQNDEALFSESLEQTMSAEG